jgi:hypothetical protein
MIRKSQASASSQPPPIAVPFRAAITGLPIRAMKPKRSWMKSSPEVSGDPPFPPEVPSSASAAWTSSRTS